MSDSNTLTIKIVGDGASFTRTMQTVDRAIKKAQTSTAQFGHSTVSSTQAASAAIRLMEGDVTNLVRAAERFIAQSKVLSGVLKTAFPVIGAIAIGGVIARGVEQVVKFVEEARKVPQALQDGFGALILTQQTANDELQKTNDTLANQIAKLEGKPQNNVALALDDARLAADKLSESLDRDLNQIQELLTQQKVGFFQGLVTGQYQTKGSAGGVNYWDRELANSGHNYNQAVHQYGGDSTQAQAAYTALQNRLQDAQNDIAARIKEVQSWQDKNGQKANLAILQGYQQILTQRQDNLTEEQDNKNRVAKQQTLEHAKQYAEQQKQYAEQQKQLAAQRLQAMEDELNQRKTVEQLDAADEYAFWQQKLSTLKAGDANYRAILAKAAPLYQSALKEHNELTQEAAKSGGILPTPLVNVEGQPVATPTSTYNWDDRLSLAASPDFKQSQESQNKATTDYLKNLNQGTDIQRENSTAIAEASLQMAVATGQISKLDAAQIQAQMHADEYADALQRLKDAIKAVAADTGLSPIEQKEQTSALQNQIQALNGQRAVQTIEDNAAINSNTLSGSIRDTLNLYVQQATDVAAQIKDILTGAFDSVNQSLSNALVAHAYNGHEYRQNILNSLGGSARGIGSQLIDTGLKNIEGGTLGKLLGGGKKPAGTASDPIFVRMAGASSGSTSSSGGLFGGLLSKLFGGGNSNPLLNPTAGADPLGLNAPSLDVSGMADTSDSDSLSFLNSLPGFANGGTTPTDTPFWVGEDGPELMSMPVPTHVTPNHQATSMSGSTNHLYIDARGSSNPAEVEMAVHRALGNYGPAAVGASVSATMERQKRVPLSKR